MLPGTPSWEFFRPTAGNSPRLHLEYTMGDPSSDFPQPVTAKRLARLASERENQGVDSPGQDSEQPQAEAPEPSMPPTPPTIEVQSASPRHQLEAWLAGMVESQASDLILRAGARPSRRVSKTDCAGLHWANSS